MSELEPKPRPIGEVPDALSAFDRLAARLDDRRPALFLDYDGTLTPIVDRPADAILDPAGREVVRRTAAALPVAVVSGRDLADVRDLVGVEGLIYAGSHGFDIQAPGKDDLPADPIGRDFTPLLDRVEDRLHAGLDAIDGTLVERKRFSIAAHYRLVADDDLAAFRRVLDDILADEGELREKPGKKVVELLPRFEWDKGRAVAWLLRALDLDGPDVVPLFFGDDVTDEDAFRALVTRPLPGIGVVVASAAEIAEGRETLADFRVDSPRDVLDLLARLKEMA